MLDQAGWHGRAALRGPENTALLPLPPCPPGPSPVERAWLSLREGFVLLRLHQSEQAIADALCAAWNASRTETGRFATLAGHPWTTQAINQASWCHAARNLLSRPFLTVSSALPEPRSGAAIAVCAPA